MPSVCPVVPLHTWLVLGLGLVVGVGLGAGIGEW